MTSRGFDPEALVEAFSRGSRHALARAISMAEGRDPHFQEVFDRIYPSVGRAFRTGITGPPGAGKSTLVAALVSLFRKAGRTVGVCAVDPTSPFSGGALLGDRIRMGEHTLDEGVFIRSMATRGSLGGLAQATVEACDVLDAFGFDRILVETVGVGQSEYDVVEATDSVVVVLHPGSGDSVQAMKAGLMEIADLFVVNKADLPGAEKLDQDLREMLELRFRKPEWDPPIVRAAAGRDQGIQEVLDALEGHQAFLSAGGGLESIRREKRLKQLRRLLEERIREKLWGPEGPEPALREAISGGGGTGPYAAVERLVARVLSRGDNGPGAS